MARESTRLCLMSKTPSCVPFSPPAPHRPCQAGVSTSQAQLGPGVQPRTRLVPAAGQPSVSQRPPPVFQERHLHRHRLPRSLVAVAHRCARTTHLHHTSPPSGGFPPPLLLPGDETRLSRAYQDKALRRFFTHRLSDDASRWQRQTKRPRGRDPLAKTHGSSAKREGKWLKGQKQLVLLNLPSLLMSPRRPRSGSHRHTQDRTPPPPGKARLLSSLALPSHP